MLSVVHSFGSFPFTLILGFSTELRTLISALPVPESKVTFICGLRFLVPLLLPFLPKGP